MNLIERIDSLLNTVAIESSEMKKITKGHLGAHLLNAYDGNAIQLIKHKPDEYKPENIALGLLSSGGYLERNGNGYVITAQGMLVVETCKERE